MDPQENDLSDNEAELQGNSPDVSAAEEDGIEEQLVEYLGNEEQAPEEEEEGEELFGDNYIEDYQSNDEQDHYDAAELDQGQYEPLTRAQIRAAEQELAERDFREGKRSRLGIGDELSQRYAPLLQGEENEEGQFLRRRARVKPTGPGLDTGLDGADLMEEDDDDNLDDDNPDDETILAGFKPPLREFILTTATQAVARKFRKFLQVTVDASGKSIYAARIEAMCASNMQSLAVSYVHLANSEFAVLAEWLITAPAEMLPILDDVAYAQVKKLFPMYHRIHQEVHVRIAELPVADRIRDIRQIHLNNLVRVVGVVTRRSSVFPQLTYSKYDCNTCHMTLGPFVQENSPVEVKPVSCPHCQSKGPFHLNAEETIYRNYQKISLQESPGSVPPGRLPRTKEVILLYDLVDSVRPGDEVEITGIYKTRFERLLNARQGFPVFFTYIEANYVFKKEDIYDSFRLTEDDERKIRDLARDQNIGHRVIQSFAPSIHGHEAVKTALAMALFGGQTKVSDKHRTRGDINVLILGDPGVAKSQFLKYVEKTAYRAVYTTGQGASAVGLTAAVRKDPVTREWTLEGGALVLADRGVCMIDEFDKMNDKDRTSIHEAMEQQTISISKAGIVTTLRARCSVIAAANPVRGRYDTSVPFSQNVELSDTILSRFDILLVLRDVVDVDKDKALAEFVISSHNRSHPANKDRQDEMEVEAAVQEDGLLTQDMLRKYILYARSKILPKITSIDKDKLTKLYAEMRSESTRGGGMPMTIRHLESMIRMSEAHAKMHLREYVSDDDVNMAIRIMLNSFITSQKYSISREMRKKFRKYLVYKRDNNEILHSLLSQCVLQNINLHKAKYGDDWTNNTVEISIEEFESRARLIDIQDLRPFYQSYLFSSNNYFLDTKKQVITKRM